MENPPLPTLPASFRQGHSPTYSLADTLSSTTIEANIVDKAYTLDIREHYDTENNRVRMERRTSDGGFELDIYNYMTVRASQPQCVLRGVVCRNATTT